MMVSLSELGRRWGVCYHTVQKYAKKLDIKIPIQESDIPRLKDAVVCSKRGRKSAANLPTGFYTVTQASQALDVIDGTLRSYAASRNILKTHPKIGIKIIDADGMEILKQHFEGRSDLKRTPDVPQQKASFSELVEKSTFLVHVLGNKQLMGFNTEEELSKFIKNSLLTGNVTVFKKIPVEIKVEVMF